MKSTQKDIIPGIPKLVADYFFVGRRRSTNRDEQAKFDEDAANEGQTPILVLKDTKSKALFAHACPCKGAHEAVVNKLIDDINMLGYRRILVRTDGEPALLDLWEKVREKWSGEIVKVESMPGDHNTNSEAEQAIQKIEDEMRTWKSFL